MGRPMNWILLIVAVLFETLGTTALKASDGLTRVWPSALVIVAYALSFWLLSIVCAPRRSGWPMPFGRGWGWW